MVTTLKSTNLGHISILPGTTFRLCWTHLEIDGSNNGISLDNFMLSNIVLPIDLVRFDVRNTSWGNHLKWQTSAEENGSLFIVQRSDSEMKAFKDLAEMPAVSHSSNLLEYEFLDRQPLSGINIYRIKMLDLDGTIDYSPLVSVKTPLQQAKPGLP
jgi:hypothetical protein